MDTHELQAYLENVRDEVLEQLGEAGYLTDDEFLDFEHVITQMQIDGFHRGAADDMLCVLTDFTFLQVDMKFKDISKILGVFKEFKPRASKNKRKGS